MYVNKFLVSYFLFFKVLLIYFGKLSFLFFKEKGVLTYLFYANLISCCYYYYYYLKFLFFLIF